MEQLIGGIWKIAVYIGYLFFGGGVLVGIGQYAVYNGFGDWFEYIKADRVEATTKPNSQKQTVRIDYTYWVNNKSYTSWLELTNKKVEAYNFYETEIYYNKKFPVFSYVGNNSQFKARHGKIGVIVCGFFFLFIFLVYNMSNREKWIKIYSGEAYKKKT